MVTTVVSLHVHLTIVCTQPLYPVSVYVLILHSITQIIINVCHNALLKRRPIKPSMEILQKLNQSVLPVLIVHRITTPMTMWVYAYRPVPKISGFMAKTVYKNALLTTMVIQTP